LDLQYDWIENSPDQDLVTTATKWLAEKTKESPNDGVQELPKVDYRKLKGEQRNVFLQVMAYFKKLKSGDQDQPNTLRLNVDGTAGTGKSFLIWTITTALRELFSDGPIVYDPVVRLAPTGVAAFGIRGWTINFGLMIPVKEGTEFNQLGQSSLARFQTRWKEIKLLILDEKSMVGRSQAGRIDRRLCQAYPQNADEILGGMPAIFFGDFAQLPPVGDSPMYSDKQSAYRTALHAEGRRVFESFNQSVTLKTVFRQTGENVEQVKFREALLRLRTYSSTPEDYALFSTQFWDILTPALRAEFDDVLHLLPTRASVLEFNCRKLVASAKPILRCCAKHNHKEASKVKSDDAEGLEKELLLAEGAKVMLNRNLWTSKGLVNGAQGVVKKIWFDQGSNARSHLPAVVFIKFDGYSGPETPAWEGIDPSWVPIVPATARWETKAGKALTRTQLPLMLAWGITIHKIQGLTLEKAVIELGDKDFSAGLTFVAISRVKTLKGLAFRTRFDHARLKKPKETDSMLMLKKDTERRDQLGFQLNTYGMDLSEYTFSED
jgi:ATP-dependent DNA helicase PIF1